MNSLFSLFVTFLVIQSVIGENFNEENYGNNTVKDFVEENAESRVLSRQKRFLVFPDGSSFQVAFCWQIAALIPIGDIFLFGNTAALGWELPSDPRTFAMLKDFEKPLRRSDVVKTINYLDEDGRIIAKVPYKRRLIVNPAFAKRSIEDNEVEKLDIKKMHDRHLKSNYLKAQDLDKDSIDFHRRNRVELYGKIEKLLSAMGRDGRQCVLYKLCEAAQRAPRQGTFLQEFLRAVFTLPKGEEFHHDEHKKYDAAHVVTDDCVVKYPGCDNIDGSLLL